MFSFITLLVTFFLPLAICNNEPHQMMMLQLLPLSPSLTSAVDPGCCRYQTNYAGVFRVIIEVAGMMSLIPPYSYWSTVSSFLTGYFNKPQSGGWSDTVLRPEYCG